MIEKIQFAWFSEQMRQHMRRERGYVAKAPKYTVVIPLGEHALHNVRVTVAKKRSWTLAHREAVQLLANQGQFPSRAP